MGRNYIDKAKRGSRATGWQEYPIHDARMPETTEDDIGKVPVIGQNGAFEYANGGTGSGENKYEVSIDDFEVDWDGGGGNGGLEKDAPAQKSEKYMNDWLDQPGPYSIKVVGEGLLEAIENGDILVIDMSDKDLTSLFTGLIFSNISLNYADGADLFTLDAPLELKIQKNTNPDRNREFENNWVFSFYNCYSMYSITASIWFAKYQDSNEPILAKSGEKLASALEDVYIIMESSVLTDVGNERTSGIYWQAHQSSDPGVD